MAEVNTDGGGGGGKHQKKRAKKSNPRIDMTPMVDLAFLLLTFFVLTANMAKPKAMEMYTPKDTKDTAKKTKIDDSKAFTLILDKNKENAVFYYTGKFDEKQDYKKVLLTPEGLRKVLLDRNKDVYAKMKALKLKKTRKEIDEESFRKQKSELDKNAPFMILKTTDNTPYKMLVDVIDELSITEINGYAIDKIADAEMAKLDVTLGRPISVKLIEVEVPQQP